MMGEVEKKSRLAKTANTYATDKSPIAEILIVPTTALLS
jgi:hypothetical protein